jgi:hypothetical protein
VKRVALCGTEITPLETDLSNILFPMDEKAFTKKFVNIPDCQLLNINWSLKNLPRDFQQSCEGRSSCLVEGRFKDIELQIAAYLLKDKNLASSFSTDLGGYGYLASPVFSKGFDELSISEIYITKIIFDSIIRELTNKEMMYFAWNVYQRSFKPLNRSFVKILK